MKCFTCRTTHSWGLLIFKGSSCLLVSKRTPCSTVPRKSFQGLLRWTNWRSILDEAYKTFFWTVVPSRHHRWICTWDYRTNWNSYCKEVPTSKNPFGTVYFPGPGNGTIALSLSTMISGQCIFLRHPSLVWTLYSHSWILRSMECLLVKQCCGAYTNMLIYNSQSKYLDFFQTAIWS